MGMLSLVDGRDRQVGNIDLALALGVASFTKSVVEVRYLPVRCGWGGECSFHPSMFIGGVRTVQRMWLAR